MMGELHFAPIIPVWLLAAGLVSGTVFCFFRIRRSGYEKKELFAAGRIVLLMLSAGLVLMRPMKEARNAEVELKNLDVLFVLDTTLSMEAMDGRDHTRIRDAKADIRYITEALMGSNFALMSFDNHASIHAPFTQDASEVLSCLKAIRIPDADNGLGTGLHIPMKDMESLMKSSSRKENRKCIVFLLSDGEITDGSECPDMSVFKDYISGGAVLGYGTGEGARIKDSTGAWVYDAETGEEAVSVIGTDNLKKLAGDMGIRYLHMESREAVNGEIREIRKLCRTIRSRDASIVNYEDLYYYAVPVIFCIVLWMLSDVIRKGGV